MARSPEYNTTSITGKIENLSGENVTVSLIDYPQDILDIYMPRTIRADRSETCNAQLIDPDTDSFEKSITIEINYSGVRYTIPVVRRILPALPS